MHLWDFDPSCILLKAYQKARVEEALPPLLAGLAEAGLQQGQGLQLPAQLVPQLKGCLD